MGPLLPALLAAVLAAVPAAAAPCPEAWAAEEHGAKWELGEEKWAELCETHKSAEKALAQAKRAFVEACLDRALPSIQAGYYHEGDARALCGEGVPGRQKMHIVQDIPRPAHPRIAKDRNAVEQGAAVGAAVGKAVGGRLASGDIAGLYGERGGGPGAVPAVAGPGGGPAQASPVAAAVPGPAGFKERPVPPVLTPELGRAANIKIIASRVVAEGVSPKAAKQARFAIAEMLREADPAVVQNLVDRKVYAYIIPKDKKLTDLEPFKDLKGKKTFDGRPWEGVRGVGNTVLPDGKGAAMAVSEESLLVDHKPGKGYPLNYVLVHEFGHMVQIHGLPTRPAPPAAPVQPGFLGRALGVWQAVTAAPERALEIGRLAFSSAPKPASFAETFDQYRRSGGRAGKSTLGAYADANEKEFFAELSAAYFDVGYENGKYNDLKKLLAERPELADMMYRVYGPARGLRGK